MKDVESFDLPVNCLCWPQPVNLISSAGATITSECDDDIQRLCLAARPSMATRPGAVGSCLASIVSTRRGFQEHVCPVSLHLGGVTQAALPVVLFADNSCAVKMCADTCSWHNCLSRLATGQLSHPNQVVWFPMSLQLSQCLETAHVHLHPTLPKFTQDQQSEAPVHHILSSGCCCKFPAPSAHHLHCFADPFLSKICWSWLPL